MRSLWSITWILFAFTLLWLPTSIAAQEQEERPQRVGFVVGGTLQTASPIDPGPDGVSRFASIFDQLGAQPLSLELNELIPDDIDIVVMIRPTRPLALRDVVYLYQFLQRGGRLLLAVDPDNYAGVNTATDRSGLDTLFSLDYGLSYQSTLMVEPWFSQENLSLNNLDASQFAVFAEDSVPHPITMPLLRYDLPLQLWGGRSLNVEPFGINSFASALLYDDTAYAETSPRLFRAEEPDPLVYNIGEDPIGRLPVGGLGLNTRNNSAVVLLGDSEMLQNGFGLDFIGEPGRPLYPGNFLFAERLAAWLLQIPPPNYPGLPDGFTWLSVDGESSDWDSLSLAEEETQVVYNDHFLYLRLDAADAEMPAQVELTLTTPEDNTENVIVTATGDGVRTGGEIIPDAAFAVADVIEIRLPLRLTSEQPRILNLCVDDTDCIDGVIRPVQLETRDPVPIRINDAPYGVIRSTGDVNLRTGPGTNFDVKTRLADGTPVSFLGRNQAGDWLYVRAGAFEGWLAGILVPNTVSTNYLDVVSPSE